MSEQCLKIIEFRSMFHRIFSVCSIVTIVATPFFIYYAISCYKNGFMIGSSAFAFLTILIVICFSMTCVFAKKHDYGKSPINPLAMQFPVCAYDAICKVFAENGVAEIGNGEYSKCIKGRNIVFFISKYYSKNEVNDLLSAKLRDSLSSLLNKAISVRVIPQKITQRNKAGIFCLFLFDRIDTDILELLTENSCQYCNTVTAFFELKTVKMYIQSLWGGDLSSDRNYRFITKTILGYSSFKNK